jgi:DnaJ-class molecular chaperone
LRPHEKNNRIEKAFGGEKAVELKELKSIYRNLMKDWHPDKFQDAQAKLEAEEKSKAIIEAYHLLVSVAPKRMHNNWINTQP